MYRDLRISVCLPCRNEAGSLKHVLAKVPKFVDEVIVISNRSTDNTVAVAKKLGVKALQDDRVIGGIGYGFAHMTGIQNATGDIIVGADGDATYPLEDLPAVIDHMLANNLDFISCNRYPLRDGTTIPFKLRLGVGILNTEVRVLRLRKIQDILSGMWVFKKEIRDDLALTAGDWNLSPQIKINAATNTRIRFAEYNIVQHKRLGESHQHYFKTGFNHLTWIFKDWLASIPSFLKRLFVQPTTNGAVQFFRYGFVALVAFVFDFGLLGVFTEKLHWFYLLSATSSFTISVVVNYMLSTAWVFSQRTKRQRSVELALFIGICLIALLLNDAFMWIFTSGLGIHYMVSKLITVTLVFFWSFGARRVVFQTKMGNAKWLRKIRATLGRAEEPTNV